MATADRDQRRSHVPQTPIQMSTYRVCLLLGSVLLLWTSTADAQSRRDQIRARIQQECGNDRECATRLRQELRAQASESSSPQASPSAAVLEGLPPRVRDAFEDTHQASWILSIRASLVDSDPAGCRSVWTACASIRSAVSTPG